MKVKFEKWEWCAEKEWWVTSQRITKKNKKIWGNEHATLYCDFFYTQISNWVLLRFPTSIPTLLSMTPLLILFRSHSNANTKPTTWKLKHETWNNPISHIHPTFSYYPYERIFICVVCGWLQSHSFTHRSQYNTIYVSVGMCVWFL